MDYQDEDFLQLSGIQHFAFCRRQWALIHIENMWVENYRSQLKFDMNFDRTSGSTQIVTRSTSTEIKPSGNSIVNK